MDFSILKEINFSDLLAYSVTSILDYLLDMFSLDLFSFSLSREIGCAAASWMISLDSIAALN